MKKPSTLVLLTESYPYGGVTEPSFAAPEMEALAAEFDKVIVAPVLEKGPTMPLPDNVEIDRTLLQVPGPAEKLRTLLTPEAWRRLNEDGRYIHSMRQAMAAMAFSAYAFHYRRLLLRMIRERNLDPDHTLFYCFWFVFQTAALSGIPGAKFITRAHRFDVYDSECAFLSHSWRDSTLAAMLRCYPVSEATRDYMHADYPDHSAKILTRRLGSCAPLGKNPPKSGGDAYFTALSIARLAPEKRVGLLLKCMDAWAAANPGKTFALVHVGSGNTEEEPMVATSPNLRVEHLGAMPNYEVHKLLGSRHFDFMAMLSSSEGLPIAACEAISYGIPVVASAVGGLPEIVTPQSGVLLSPNPVPEEFVSAMNAAMPRLGQLRESAANLWAEQFDSRPLRQKFAHEIRNLLPK